MCHPPRWCSLPSISPSAVLTPSLRRLPPPCTSLRRTRLSTHCHIPPSSFPNSVSSARDMLSSLSPCAQKLQQKDYNTKKDFGERRELESRSHFLSEGFYSEIPGGTFCVVSFCSRPRHPSIAHLPGLDELSDGRHRRLEHGQRRRFFSATTPPGRSIIHLAASRNLSNSSPSNALHLTYSMNGR